MSARRIRETATCHNPLVPEPRIYLHRLTSLRFFAALVVVLHHITRDVAPIPGLSQLTLMGTAGVGFFFALSGFILTWSHKPDDTLGRFYRKRFARIYPLHLATFIISILVLIVIGSSFSPAEALTNVLLVQSWVPDSDIYFGMNAPSWSLACEALFYAVFPFVIPLIRRLSVRRVAQLTIGTVVLNLVIAIIVTIATESGEASRFLLYVFPPFRFLGFIAGCALAHWMTVGLRPRTSMWIPVVAMTAAYIAVFAGQRVLGQDWGHGIEDALLLPVILWLIAVAAAADLQSRPGILRSRPLRLLGEWSFALYLTHWLLAQGVEHYAPGLKEAPLGSRVAADAAFVVVAIAIAAALYYTIERPAERILRGSTERPAMREKGRA
ncbi:acyltransferase family protein [Microbacterium radiodurans]|uniref:Acyltransferase n=1 Tax=Microbacterium radiodurans TaxID=661398 RepID=A0A5J5IML9_9MICO|nr:acyltransferase [Microbacterium radiodurans]KAA9083734.1 acyltransferase [Microbacterium radiodurans]